MATIYEAGGKFVDKGSFVKKGTTIIEAKPFVAVLNNKFRTELCDVCFKRCKVSRCSGCQYVYYCSRNCQKQSWPVHKIECPNIKRVYPKEVPEAARIIARIIIKMQNGGDEEKGYYSSCEYRKFKDLMSHCSNIKQDIKRMEHFTSLCAVLYEFLPHSILPNVKELLEIFGRLCINSFYILDSLMVSIGVGIYLGPSIINHSCKPSAVVVFDGTKLIVRSLIDISSFDWSKVSISYINLLKCVEERREELAESYYFLCDCERCKNPPIAETAAACPNKNCTNPCISTDSKCRKCGYDFPPDFDEKFEETMNFSLRHLEKMKNNPSLDICEMCLKKQEGVLHPLNLLHVRMLVSAVEAAEKEMGQEKEIYASKLAQKYQHYYGDSHPITGNMYLSMALDLTWKKKPKQAIGLVRKATEVLELGFGENHSKMNVVKKIADWTKMEYTRFNDDL